MKTVEKETVIEFEEKKSKFIGYIKPVSTVEEAEKFIASIREMHPNATHNVPLYRVVEEGQEYFKYNDSSSSLLKRIASSVAVSLTTFSR